MREAAASSQDRASREVIELLVARGETVAAAESLTGGMLAAALTAIPGASAVFRGAVVAYATDIKAALLDVPSALLDRHGAVHPAVAAAMAEGARRRLDAGVGAATTGVAGPDPADGQPVGTVHIAVSTGRGTTVRSLTLSGGRHQIRVATVERSLALLISVLREENLRLQCYVTEHAAMPSPARSVRAGTVVVSAERPREGSATMVLLRHLLGDALRRLRLRQGRTLREVSAAARVSLGYLSEVERGQKEASSELLASICGALGAPLSQVLREVSDNFALAELQSEPVFSGVREPSHELTRVPEPGVPAEQIRLSQAAARKMAVSGGSRFVPAAQPEFERVTRGISDIKDMVPV